MDAVPVKVALTLLFLVDSFSAKNGLCCPGEKGSKIILLMNSRILFLIISLISPLLLVFQLFSKWKYRNAETRNLKKGKDKIGDSFVLYFLPYTLICIPCQIMELVFICKLYPSSTGFTQLLLSLIALCFILGGVFGVVSYLHFRKLFSNSQIDSPNRNAFYSSILVLVESITLWFSFLSFGIAVYMLSNGVLFK